MTNEAEPNWSLLPHDPEGFFGLDADYDVRDLKRRYNAYLRRFKPEGYPAEFQRIRAAYENLFDALRYGERHGPPVRGEVHFNWNDEPDLQQPKRTKDDLNQQLTPADAENDSTDSFDAPLLFEENSANEENSTIEGNSANNVQPETELPRPLYDRLREESPQTIYTELKSQPAKSPYVYYALAVLSDVVADDEQTFSSWLLAGLQQHPHETGLFHLLRDFLATDVAIDDAPAMLEEVSHIVRNDRFYYLTERLWDRLLRDETFAEFRRTLECCEANLLDHAFDNQVTFYLRILKPAIWKADTNWIDSTFAHVEEHFEQLPGWAEAELDLLGYLREYHSRRREFLEDAGPMRAQIDLALMNFCVLEELDADRCFLECQHSLASHGEQLLREFKPRSPGFEYVLIPWERIADEVAERVGDPPAEIDGKQLTRRVLSFGRRLMEESRRRGATSVYNFFMSTFLLPMLSAIAGLFYYGYLFFQRLFDGLQILSALGAILKLLGVLIASFIVLGILVFLEGWLIRRYYRIRWRWDMMEFFTTTSLPLLLVADEFERVEGQTVRDVELEKTEALANCLRKDTGLSLFVTAQQFLR